MTLRGAVRELNAAVARAVITGRVLMQRLTLGLLLAVAGFGQNAAREFHLTAPANMQEIVTTLRVVGKIPQVEANAATGTLTIRGNSLELALAEWLVPELDRAVASGAGAAEYRVSGNEAMLVYSLAHTMAPAGMQEIITTLRTVADIQLVYLVNAAKTIPLRGTPTQIALAKFMISELDRPEQRREGPVVHRFLFTENPTTAVVYGLVHAPNMTSVQEILTTLRSVPQTQRVYNVTGPKMLCFRETAEMAPVVEWLISELDRASPNTGPNEMRMPGSKDDVLRVFYPAHLSAGSDLQAMLKALRAAMIQRVYSNSVPPALIVRGTADQIHLAGQLIAQKDVAVEPAH